MERITGDQARELLDDFNNPRTFLGHVRTRPLLETLAWLYGRECTSADGDGVVWADPLGRLEVVADNCPCQVFVQDHEGSWAYTPDEAVELARALLAAAEMARTM